MSRAQVTDWDRLNRGRAWAEQHGWAAYAAVWWGLHLLMLQPPQSQATQGFAVDGDGTMVPHMSGPGGGGTPRDPASPVEEDQR